MNVQLLCEGADRSQFDALCTQWQLTHTPDAPLALVLTNQRLELRKLDEPKLGAIAVDFLSGAMAHRRQFGGGRGEAVAKAVGVKKGATPHVIDATAGLGRDAFVLACIGCRVQLVERHPVVAALLEDGLKRAYADPELGAHFQQHLQLLPVRSILELPLNASAEVVYLDPMYPHKAKSALVKKEMRVFQTLVGADEDADQFLAQAKALASRRVVVKRPDYADFLDHAKPDFSHTTKNHRFDVYLTPKPATAS